MKVLRAGWEHREQHPQLVLVTTWTDEGAGTGGLIYNAGGSFAEGDGYMQTQFTGWPASVDKAYIQADYKIKPSRELWIHVDVRPMETDSGGNGWLTATRTRIGWDSSNNPDPGYVELSHVGNTLKWNWSGGSGSTPLTVTKNTWYHVKIRVRVSGGGNEIVQVWVDGVRVYNVSQDLTVGYTLIDRIYCYSYADTIVNGGPRPHAGFDNLCVNDVVGAFDNSDPGQLYLLGRVMDNAGLWAAWTRAGVDDGSNVLQVDEVPPDQVSWVESSVEGTKDTHSMENLPATVDGKSFTIERFGIRTWAKASAGGAGVAGIICLGGGSIPQYSGGSLPHGTNYGPYEYWWRLNPDSSTKFSEADINNLQPGYRVGA